MASRSHHGSVLCQNPTNQANRDLISNLRKSKPCLTKPTPQTCSTTFHDQNPKIWSPKALPRATTCLSCLRKSPICRLKFLTSRSSSWYTRCPDGLLVHRSTEPEIPALIRTYTRPHAPLRFPASLARASGLLARAIHVPENYC